MRREHYILIGIEKLQSRIILENRFKTYPERKFLRKIPVHDPVAVLELVESPFYRLALDFFRHRHSRIARSTGLDGSKIYSAYIQHHGLEVAVVLVGKILIPAFAQGCIRIILIRHPLVKMGEDILKVLHSIVGSLDRIIAEILLDGTRVISVYDLLTAITESRVSRPVIDPFLYHRCLLFHGSRVKDGLICIFDKEIVIDTELRRSQGHALVLRLGDIIEPGIVHYGRSSTVFRRK